MANNKKKKSNTAEKTQQTKAALSRPKFNRSNEQNSKGGNLEKTSGKTSLSSYRLNNTTKQESAKLYTKNPIISKDGWLIIHAAIALLMLISIFGLGGFLGSYLRRLQIGLLGVLGNVFPFVYAYCAFSILSAKDKVKIKKKMATIALLMVSLSSLVFLMIDESLTDVEKLLELYFEDSSCGALGGLFGGLIKNMVSRGGGFVVFLALLVFCIIYLSNKSLHEKMRMDGIGFSGIFSVWSRFRESIESKLNDEEDDEDYGIEVDPRYMQSYEPDYYEEVPEETVSKGADKRQGDIFGKRTFDQREAAQRTRSQKVYGVNFGSLDMKPLTNTESVLQSTLKARQEAKKQGFLQEENDFFGGISFLKKSGLFGNKPSAQGQFEEEKARWKKTTIHSDGEMPLQSFSEVEMAAEESEADGSMTLEEFQMEFSASSQNTLPFDERMITADEDLTKKSGFSTPEESIRMYAAHVQDRNIVVPKRYEEVTLLHDKEEDLDEETIRKVKEILARRGEIVLTKKSTKKEEIQRIEKNQKEQAKVEPEIVIHKTQEDAAMEKEIRIHRSKEEENFNEVKLSQKSEMQSSYDFEEELTLDDFQTDDDDLMLDDSFSRDFEESIPTLTNRKVNVKTPNRAEESVSKDKFRDKSEIKSALKNIDSAQADKQVSSNKNNSKQIRIQREEIPYTFPPNSLLARNPKQRGGFNDDEFRQIGMKLQQTLKNFGVNVTVTDISIGPVVTRFELQPEQGVKVNKIVNLADDIKLSLAAKDIRIQAPIPGKPAVGIEVPNKESSMVYFRDLIETEEFRSDKYKIAFAIGKDIAGKPVITDITNMPHLLIAGATGSGKSVCINTIIMSILYKYSPADVKMIMIDPKVVELSVYNGIPHLLIPVVTEAKKAAGALNWAVAEMSDRFKKFAEVNVRNIKGYNKKIEEAAKKVSSSELPEKMPNIVIVIDELADLMMVAQNEVESSICRIAQLARACGIHLVIATQRPSVNVITGLIKANIPTRIAFAVSSAIDSRTILDVGGAEKLLGKGDMLFNPPGGIEHIRIQGAFISDNEVQEVVEYVKNQGFEAKVDEETVTNIVNTINTFKTEDENDEEERDELFASVGRYIVKKKKASKGNLQIVFKIGFNRSARIIEQLYQAGVVGDDLGTKPRDVLMDEAQFESLLERLNLA